MRPDSKYSGRRRRGGSNRGNRGGNSSPSRSTPAKPLTWWDKVRAFFAGGATTNGHSAPRPERRERSESTPRTSRKPEVVEVSSPKLYVGNLSFDATESDLFDLFNGVGKVQSAEIVSHKYNQKSKGFAFVMMQSIEEARRAVEELHDKDFMGRKLVVSGAKTSDVRDAA